MPTMYRRLTERDLDRLLHERQTEAAIAAQQIIQRANAERQRTCPPCHGNCNQGDTCPARLAEQRLADQRGAEARAKVEADAQLSDLPLDRAALLAYVGFLAGIVLLSHAFAAGWF